MSGKMSTFAIGSGENPCSFNVKNQSMEKKIFKTNHGIADITKPKIKQYRHDYTKLSEVEELLYRASRLLANDCFVAASERINEARQLLLEYIE